MNTVYYYYMSLLYDYFLQIFLILNIFNMKTLQPKAIDSFKANLNVIQLNSPLFPNPLLTIFCLIEITFKFSYKVFNTSKKTFR